MKYEIIVSLLICVGVTVTAPVQKRSDDVSIGALEAEVGRLASQVTSLTAETTALKIQVTSQQTKIDSLEKTVAFHTIGGPTPVNATAGGPIVMKQVVTNIGHAFDPLTGFFTAPVSGLYQFHATFMGAPGMQGYVHAEIIVDGHPVALSISDSRHGFYDNTGIDAVVHVSAGKKVYVRNADETTSSYHGGTYLSFSGFLLHVD